MPNPETLDRLRNDLFAFAEFVLNKDLPPVFRGGDRQVSQLLLSAGTLAHEPQPKVKLLELWRRYPNGVVSHELRHAASGRLLWSNAWPPGFGAGTGK